MRRPRVYVETTIPSFYFDQRRTPWMVARRRWTRAWWDVALERYDLVTSLVTLRELAEGPGPRRDEWLEFVHHMQKLEMLESVTGIAAAYVRHRVMPARGEDAVHLAVASVHACDYLVTWDIRHIANARKALHIRKINVSLGLHVPIIVTPLEMLGRMP